MLAMGLVASGASAKELVRTDGGVVLEASGFAKTLVSSVWLQPSLVEGTEALQTAVDEARALVPPEQAALLPSDVRLPSHVLLDAHVLRVGAKGRYAELVAVDVAWQLTALLASDGRFSAGSSLTGTIGGAGNPTSAQRRLVDLSSVMVNRPGLRVEQQLDRLSVRLSLPFGDLTVGRQALSWGTGRVWNPTDVLSPFPPTVVDREVRRGFDAVRLAVELGATTQLDLLYLPQQQLADQGGVARLQTNLGGWDVSASVGKYVQDVVVGADVVGDVGPVAVHGEGAYTFGLSGLGQRGSSVTLSEHFFRGVVGADWRPHEKVLVMVEYHFNGYGAGSPSEYVAKLSSPRVVRGEVFGAGRHFLALVGSWAFHDLASLALTALGNLQDPSVLLIPALEWSFEQTVLVRVGGNVPIGARPDAAVFRSLTGGDVLLQSQAFGDATRTFGFRSELGSSAFSAFVQVGLHVP